MRLILPVLLLVLVIACNEKLTAGYVVDKQYHPEREWYSYIQIPHETCVSDGKAQICTTYYTSQPLYHHDPERWSLKLKACGNEGQCKESWIDVDRETWQAAKMNSWYDRREPNH